MSTILPDTEVKVDSSRDADTGKVGIAITTTRGDKSRTWSGEGNSIPEATKGAVEKMLRDRRNVGEFI